MKPVRENTATSALFQRSGVRYEVACDVIGAVISHYAEFLAIERDKARPDLGRIAHASQLLTELRNARDVLSADDEEAVEATIARMGPLARHLFFGDRNDVRGTLEPDAIRSC